MGMFHIIENIRCSQRRCTTHEMRCMPLPNNCVTSPSILSRYLAMVREALRCDKECIEHHSMCLFTGSVPHGEEAKVRPPTLRVLLSSCIMSNVCVRSGGSHSHGG